MFSTHQIVQKNSKIEIPHIHMSSRQVSMSF